MPSCWAGSAARPGALVSSPSAPWAPGLVLLRLPRQPRPSFLSLPPPGNPTYKQGAPGSTCGLLLGVSTGSEESRVPSQRPRNPNLSLPGGRWCRGSSPTGVSSGRLNSAMFPLVLPTPLSKKWGAKLARARKRTKTEGHSYNRGQLLTC